MRVGIVDTTFARVDMARYAIEELQKINPKIIIERWTVPGIKNIPWAIKKLLTDKECDAGIVFGWVGKSLTDKLSYLVFSIAITNIQLETGKPIIDVTVHEDEAEDEKELLAIAIDRSRKHARNLILMMRNELIRWAGMGLRQGRPDVGPITLS